MRVHHLNCGTMCPVGARLINGTGGAFEFAKMICHCLLIESNDGLVLVDTGFGLEDIRSPDRRLGFFFHRSLRAALDTAETAAAQIKKLGFALSDVRHIIPTHLDLDHAGGLSDFPRAKVHLHEREYTAATRPITLFEKNRYRSAQWAHGPDWALHNRFGERWFGFDAVKALDGKSSSDILLVPLHGHTRGHCGVAVQRNDGWLLHCGDAYFFHGEVDPDSPHCTPGLALAQRAFATDDQTRRDNQQRLRRLNREQGSEINLFCAHDPVEFDRERARIPQRTIESAAARSSA